MVIKSWRTTLAGFLQMLAVVSLQLQTLLDNDVMTNPDWNLVVLSVSTFIGLAMCRDDKVTSEEAGAR